MKRKVQAAIVALVAMFSITVVAPTPAQAAYSDCWIGYVCIWDGDNGSNALLFSAGGPGVTSPTCINVPSSANDKADSFYNNRRSTVGGRDVRFWLNAGCSGRVLCMENFGGCGPFFPGVGKNFNFADTNELTSIQLLN